MLVPVKLTILGPPREVRRFSLASPVRGSALLSAAATACSCSRREISLRVTGTLLLVRSGTNEDAILPALTPPLRVVVSRTAAPSLPYRWIAGGGSDADEHVAFRLTFSTSVADTTVVIAHAGVSWYNVFVDGDRIAEGPTRWCAGAGPYYASSTVTLADAGRHVVAIHAHSVGEQTRILLKTSPFVAADVASTDPARPLGGAPAWKCSSLAASYVAQWMRMSNLLGWMENCTLSSALTAWIATDFDDASWAAPVAAPHPPATALVPLADIAGPASSKYGLLAEFTLAAHGTLFERYGYPKDDVAACFRLRELIDEGAAPTGLDYGAPQGVWWRFDAQRCRLLRPELRLSAPAGCVVEIAYSQALIDGKASPYTPLCGSTSCYIDRYVVGASVVAGESVVVCPLEPRGCRWVEVHVTSNDAPAALDAVRLLSARALFRSYDAYHAEPDGAFACASDALLTKIWKVGIDTTRSCAEDTAIDGPCRERGQWTGDTLAVTLPNVVAAYNDVRIIKITLLQSSAAANAEGVISGNCPEGGVNCDYALIWFVGASKYLEATGDFAALKLLMPRARKCMDYFLSPACYKSGVGFTFTQGAVIDWGYIDNHTFAVSVPLNALMQSALAALVAIATAVGDVDAKATYTAALATHTRNFTTLLGLPAAAAGGAWDPAKLGMHGAALVLRAGLLAGAGLSSARSATQSYIKAQLSACFPINRSAPRLSDPSRRSSTGFYTPYFQTFTFEGLFEAGDAEWCLGQYRAAWGWALTQSSTWLEVFDVRWEAVHSWGGCPTWQLSRYTLGLAPRFDVGARHFVLDLHVGTNLPAVSGRVPARVGGAIVVAWTRADATSVHLTLTLDAPAFIAGWPGGAAGSEEWTQLGVGTHTVLVKGCA